MSLPFFRPKTLSLLFLAVMAACSTARAHFTDVSSRTGIENVQASIPDDIDNHGGAGAVDVDGDGYTDILLAKYRAAPLLYMNLGDGTFVNEALARGLGEASDVASFGAADFDNDGDVDILTAPYESKRFRFYINDGSGHFTEESVERGADNLVVQHPHDGYSIGIVDYNRDGYLDAFVSQWGVGGAYESHKFTTLLRNRGSEAPGHFENVTLTAGLDMGEYESTQWNFSSGWADFDGDLWPDLALVADFGRSRMFWNNGNGTFEDTTEASGVGLDKSGMGIAVADYDADGYLDFYVSAIFDELHCETDEDCSGGKLYRYLGDRKFEEVSEVAGVARPGWGWGASFFEYDNDGDFDLVVTNGMPVPDSPLANPGSADDPTTLFINERDGSFSDGTTGSGIDDTKYGRAALVVDFDNDGDEDLIIVNAFSDPIVYQSDASENGNDWIRFSFEGTHSNRDGIGCVVRLTEAGGTQTLAYNPTNAYIGQREAFLHFGLGAGDGQVDEVEVIWPSGIRQTLTGVSAHQVHHLVEPEDATFGPFFSFHPQVDALLGIGDRLELLVELEGSPKPSIQWYKNGAAIPGATSSELLIKSLANLDEGIYHAVATAGEEELVSEEVEVVLDFELDAHSVARWWNEFLLEAVRRDFPDPTKHSRNLYHVSAAMWDAFWPYEEEQWAHASPVFHREEVAASDWGGDPLAAQRQAISHAAYTVLIRRYEKSPGAEASLYGFRWLMQQLGYDPDDRSVIGDNPAAVGNRIGNAVLEINYNDGSNELGDYSDTSGYEPVNEPMPVDLSGADVVDINRWQPLLFQNAVSQNGLPIGELTQTFLGVNWREVDTFALAKPSPDTIAFDPGPPPQYSGGSKDEFIEAVVDLIRYSSYLDPDDDELIDISPGALLNNSLGANDGMGRPVNPFNGEAYAPNVVKRSDYGRILAEFWADGPASETPPGHWNTLHNEVSDHPLFERRYMGSGDPLSKLQWDVQAYLALNGAMHDAAVAAWTLKRQYDYSRPITMIRYFGGNGQSSDPSLPAYHADGLPLIPGLIELVSAESASEGERHERLRDSIGQVAIRAWAGEPDDGHAEAAGVDWILAIDWMPYQRSTFVTPAFAAYVSGHSAFSRAGAEIMTLLTGDPFFPGGMGRFDFPKNAFLEFEQGPSDNVTLQWATYYDAADQAGLSRLFGGIHVSADDLVGRALGSRVGVEAFVKATSLRCANDPEHYADWVELDYRLPVEGDIPLVYLEHRSEKPLPILLLPSERSEETGDDGIYLIRQSGAADSRFKMLARGGGIREANLTGTINRDTPIALDLRIGSEAAQLALASAWIQESAARDPSLALTVLEQTVSGWEILDSNRSWNRHELSSVSNALSLRTGVDLRELLGAVAIPMSRGMGTYRLLLECEAEARVAFSVKIQSGGDSL